MTATIMDEFQVLQRNVYNFQNQCNGFHIPLLLFCGDP